LKEHVKKEHKKNLLDISTLRLTQPSLVELGIGLSFAKLMALIAVYNSRATGKLLPARTNTVINPIPITFFFWVIFFQMPDVRLDLGGPTICFTSKVKWPSSLLFWVKHSQE
jgi:hypothetical protein